VNSNISGKQRDPRRRRQLTEPERQLLGYLLLALGVGIVVLGLMLLAGSGST
jgi:hypothetical protein